MEELLLFLNQVATLEGWPLSAECLAHLRKIIKKATLKKDEFILRSGEVCENMYFISDGLLKCFYMLHGKQVCEWFFGRMETVVSIGSFYDQVPGVDYMQALQDSVLYYITYDELNYLYRTFIEFNVVGRALTNKYLRIWYQQARNIRMLSAKERYEYFLKTHPELVNLIPVQDLASHLDMVRETLSRMRGQVQ